MNGIPRFLFETGHLKVVSRSGWWLAGVRSPESVAEHSFRTAVIGYVLACLEGADPERTASLCLFHDFAESRINDPHPIVKTYMDLRDKGRQILTEIADSLPRPVQAPIRKLAVELSERRSLESRIAKEADLLECALQAREYECLGVQVASQWIPSMRSQLTTRRAKRLLDECMATDPNEWWRSLLTKTGGPAKGVSK
jgi:putative hydrolase of HD superfamily